MNAERRAAILSLERELAKHEQVDCPLKHHFAPGMYAREIFIQAGTCVTGKLHRHAHLNIISQGVVEVVTEFGRDRFESPYTFVSVPGTKRALIALTDTIWTTIHPTDSTDLDEIEQQVIATEYDELPFMALQLEERR